MLECFLLLVLLSTLAGLLMVVVVVVTTHVRGKYHLGSTYVLHRYACALPSAKEKQTFELPAPAVLRVRRPVVLADLTIRTGVPSYSVHSIYSFPRVRWVEGRRRSVQLGVPRIWAPVPSPGTSVLCFGGLSGSWSAHVCAICVSFWNDWLPRCYHVLYQVLTHLYTVLGCVLRGCSYKMDHPPSQIFHVHPPLCPCFVAFLCFLPFVCAGTLLQSLPPPPLGFVDPSQVLIERDPYVHTLPRVFRSGAGCSGRASALQCAGASARDA